ncbi:unnamed protein product [Allacma fusca]|uniref:Uncharacterized protein n=1 Tax=Allacma fusca TaxID=39272 RepID=A0A8J2Q5Z6_9HEXA|nr:unnamed protein product [Allacma fusca]
MQKKNGNVVVVVVTPDDNDECTQSVRCSIKIYLLAGGMTSRSKRTVVGLLLYSYQGLCIYVHADTQLETCVSVPQSDLPKLPTFSESEYAHVGNLRSVLFFRWNGML